MWRYTELKTGNDTTKYTLCDNNSPLSYAEVVQLLCTSEAFRTFFTGLLKSNIYAAYFWEVRPVTAATASEAFEFVLVDAPLLASIAPDNSAFLEHFGEARAVTSFFNLNKDAKLIVPVERSNAESYSHLANFVRSAPLEQVALFWKKVGEEIRQAIGTTPKWVSTSGLGVHWLHVRIDTRPKYYNFSPYKTV